MKNFGVAATIATGVLWFAGNTLSAEPAAAPAAKAPVKLPAKSTAPAPEPAPAAPGIELPLDRNAYFTGESIFLAPTGVPAAASVSVALAGPGGKIVLYTGAPRPLLLETASLAPGEYQLELDGKPTGQRLFLVTPLRRSAGSMQDEGGASVKVQPPKNTTKDEAQNMADLREDQVAGIVKESGLTAFMSVGSSDGMRRKELDALARNGALLLVNPETRPTSFLPTGNIPFELDHMTQRMMLIQQANARHPNFGGFMYGWDTGGFAQGTRRMLLTYWNWGKEVEPLRHYIDEVDRYMNEEFTRRTGLQPVTEAEYIAYLLAIKRPEFAPAIDLPTKLWLDDIARSTKPMNDSERAEFEKRLDAYSSYLMGLYNEAYSYYGKNLRGIDPSIRNTSSVQIDHAPVRQGQYLPSANAPLDFRYQSTWNDQVAAPTYAYQWLLTAGMLDMGRQGQPSWISNVSIAARGRGNYPGKMTRLAAHGLAWGVSGIGFAFEGFSTLIGGMDKNALWESMKGKPGEQDVLSGRDFLDRFACLAVDARGDHGVGVLFSKSQFQRQHVTVVMNTNIYKMMVTLTRLGYTPRLVTEEELAAGSVKDIKALLIVGQTVPLPADVVEKINQFAKAGGRVLVDRSTKIDLSGLGGAEKIPLALPYSEVGKVYCWSVPNITSADSDAAFAERVHRDIAPAFAKALGTTGHAIFMSDQGADTRASLIQIDGGPDAKFIVAVNDSYVKNAVDWFQLREKFTPIPNVFTAANPDAVVYDCNDEKSLGRLGPIEGDLTRTTARVYAIVAREVKSTALSATQRVKAGTGAAVRVQFLDGAGKALAAVLPFQLELRRPDGVVEQAYYRSTDRTGEFAMRVPLGVNAPTGEWTLAVRSQLTGVSTTLPLTVEENKAGAPAAHALASGLVVRNRSAIDEVLTGRGARPVIPVFDSPEGPAIKAVAEKIRAALARQGVDAEVVNLPGVSAMGTYTLSYRNTPEENAVNARIDKGELIGKITRRTANGNDWYSAQSGFRSSRPVILLDLAGQKSVNPMAAKLDASGLLWPGVSSEFPGTGGAVVQGISWCFAPRVSSVVIQASDIAGLHAAADSITQLPQDLITPGVQKTRDALWREFHVGGKPEKPSVPSLSAVGVKSATEPRPFAMNFSTLPPTPEQVEPAVRTAREPLSLPATIDSKAMTPMILDGDEWVEAASVGPLVADLRFSEGIAFTIDVAAGGATRFTAEGLFRYSDRKPCWQPQWEDIIELREKIVPRERLPMEIDVVVNGNVVGKLLPTKTEQATVKLEMQKRTHSAELQTAIEEAVVELSGEIELPPGKREILLVHHNMVDGRYNKITVKR